MQHNCHHWKKTKNENINQQKIQLISEVLGPGVICLTSSYHAFSWKKVTPQRCFSSAVGGNKSVNLQRLYRMYKMCHEHEEEEDERGHWVGRRKRKTVVIKAERESKCRRMQVVPVVLDEVLFSCWATKLFIYKTLTACGHGRENCYTDCSFFPISRSLTSVPLLTEVDWNKGINLQYTKLRPSMVCPQHFDW